jgi:hypothetical protein
VFVVVLSWVQLVFLVVLFWALLVFLVIAIVGSIGIPIVLLGFVGVLSHVFLVFFIVCVARSWIMMGKS